MTSFAMLIQLIMPPSIGIFAFNCCHTHTYIHTHTHTHIYTHNTHIPQMECIMYFQTVDRQMRTCSMVSLSSVRAFFDGIRPWKL